MKNLDLTVITNRTCTNRCEHCDSCNYDDKYTNINTIEFRQIIKDSCLFSRIILFGGEPSIHSKFYEFIKIINLNFKTPGIVTNGWMLEKKILSKIFWKNLSKVNTKNIFINLSIDIFHLPFFLTRNSDYTKEDYPFILFENLKSAKKYGISVDLEINWVISNDKKHNCPGKMTEIISEYLQKMVRLNYINSYLLTFEPLQVNNKSELFNKNNNKNYLIKSIPDKQPYKFNHCQPVFTVLRDNDNTIKYSFCMRLGKKSFFSKLGNNLNKDLNLFLDKHNILRKNFTAKTNIFQEFKKNINSKYFLELINKECECFKKNNACFICKSLFDNKYI